MIEICEPKLKTNNLFDFMYEHLDCDCIVDTTNELIKDFVEIIAFAKNMYGNEQLRAYYLEKNFKSPIMIVQGISHMEVDCIDSI